MSKTPVNFRTKAPSPTYQAPTAMLQNMRKINNAVRFAQGANIVHADGCTVCDQPLKAHKSRHNADPTMRARCPSDELDT